MMHFWLESTSLVHTAISAVWTNDVLTLLKMLTMVTEFNESNFTNIGPQLAKEIPFVQGSPNQYLKGMYRNSMFLLPHTR